MHSKDLVGKNLKKEKFEKEESGLLQDLNGFAF